MVLQRLRVFPLTLIPLIIYAIAMVFSDETVSQVAGPDVAALHPLWDQAFAKYWLVSGQPWSPSYGDLLATVAAVIFFFSVLRAASYRSRTILGNMLSVVILCVYIISFLTIAEAGTSVFFLLTVFALMDVLAAVALSMITSRAKLSGAIEG